ncbi:hypothetical protein DQ239_15400 [Blastococcus sp. TF02-09]|uniref:hypothetical protein n=1 Tax=Blastococcus sp. TF02-09 TaxID=2250576 RepID=UPI000DE887CD|nr:hypothetical protein [Blastococcus sp. TF02-9]RBY75901.1 hypothetical protein DQ239_15400 [Blastococcus sp. TF02-9]
MSTPRDRDSNDDDAGRGWQEPAHLGGDQPARDEPVQDGPVPDEPNIADRRSRPRDADHSVDPETWRPPGWDLPPARPERSAPEGAGPAGVDPSWAPPGAPPQEAPARERRGLFGGRRQRDPEMDRAFTYQGDVVGAQGWALQRGWTISDGTAPEDAALLPLITTAPPRMSKDHRPGNVLRGRAGSLDLIAFDAVYTSGRYVVPEYAITAAPLLGTPPALRLSPARLWKHGIGGMVQIPSEDPDFDRRWMLLAAEDGPQVRRLAGDADVRRLLLGTDDGDEFWTTPGFLAAIRPDGHRPELIEHHARLLTALVGALAVGS